MLKDDRPLYKRIQELEGNPNLTKVEKENLIKQIETEIPEEQKPENLNFRNLPEGN